MAEHKQKRPDVYRKEFIQQLAVNADISEFEADVLTTKFLITLTETLLDNKSICFPDFGIFELHTTSERVGRNPRTMETHVIPARVKPVFRASRALFASVNEALQNQLEQDDEEDEEVDLSKLEHTG